MTAQVLAAFFWRQSFGLTAFSDILQCVLLFSGTLAFIPLTTRSHGRTRLFWLLIVVGLSLWTSYQLWWTYFEVILRREVPDLSAWDAVLFLHIVPWTAALALRPQVQRDEYSARVGRLDFALLLVWWFYLYVLIVMPWQYVVASIQKYNRNLNNLYSAEKIVLLLGLLACWLTTNGKWRKLYQSLFWMTISYSAGSTLANWAIQRNAYYSGSLYDVPIIAAMASLSWIGLRTRIELPEAEAEEASTLYGVWVARCGMIAVFSLAWFAVWAIADSQTPLRIRSFRLSLTFLAALGMGVMVLIRQQLLDRELVRLLQRSREAFDNLKRLQAQILQSEKLASVGQLVGGAAHELNNPITAMLGYSDLLLNTTLTGEQRPLAERIGLSVRRTKSLVASLISFARQTKAAKTPLDLNTLARTAVKLAEPQWQALQIDVRTEFDSRLSKVLGDSNQLLQVCLQLLGNGLHVLSDRGGRVLNVSTKTGDAVCSLQIATEPIPRFKTGEAPLTKEEYGLGLAACEGILREHEGHISQQLREDGALLLSVELPVVQTVQVKAKEATVPVLWQSRPYA
ncbi:MAG TPA: histidine kinase dimerization/phospho-acceptor domain-containing protein [Candidatus Eisenbacteria bacterium]|nr:histidine kinase dimerization/phospho-acceptor domain-containing protein [Candidatus Eisenbacteria bacterium]